MQAYFFELCSEQQQVEPSQWFCTTCVKFVTAILFEQSPQIRQIVLLLRCVPISILSHQVQLQPHPVFGGGRDLGSFPIQLESANKLIQGGLELIDKRIVTDMSIEIIVKLISLSLGQSAFRRLHG